MLAENVPPLTFPTTIVFPLLETKALALAFVPPTKLPVIVIKPKDVLFITTEGLPDAPRKFVPDKLKLLFPLCNIMVEEAIEDAATSPPNANDTLPVVAVTVIKLVAPADNGDVDVTLPDMLPLLKLNEPPAASAAVPR